MANFRKLADNLVRLAQVPSRIAPRVAAAINVAIAEQFAQGKDAYGKPWARLLPQTVRRKGGDSRVLLRTDRMADSTVARPARGAGVELTTIDYAGFHQTGTKHMKPREVLPDRGDLPVAWQQAIGAAYREAFGKAMSG